MQAVRSRIQPCSLAHYKIHQTARTPMRVYRSCPLALSHRAQVLNLEPPPCMRMLEPLYHPLQRVPSRICRPSTRHLVKTGHSLVPTAFAFAGGRGADGGRERGAAQASKQATDAIVIPKNKGGELTAVAPSQGPYNFPFISDAGLSGWKGILLAALAVIHS